MSLDEALDGVETALHYQGNKGLGWYIRMKGRGHFGFGKTVAEAVVAAKRAQAEMAAKDELVSQPRRRVLIEEEQPRSRRRSLFD